jgi:ATP-dependent helicase/DNAse subunit B
MAEHVRNELARASIHIRPRRVSTLAKFIEPFTAFSETPDSLLHLLAARFGPGSEFRGYHRALAALLAEAHELPPDLSRIAAEIEVQLALRGRALREKRLRTAVPVANGPVVLDGFFTLSPGELDVLEKLASQTSVIVTLPDWPGSAPARQRLLDSGFTEEHFPAALRQPRRIVSAALSAEQEVEQIAGRILEQRARGREFRDMGVLLRVRDPYASALETAFARFGIPARFHFTDTLASHPAIQYITGLIRTLLAGWDHADLVKLLRMPVSGFGATPEGDRLDFEMRESLPSSGADNFGGSGAFSPLLDLARERLIPSDWAARLKTIRTLIPAPNITDQTDRVQLQIWRSTAAALAAFDEVLDTVALALDDNAMPLARFWPSVETALSIEKLRVPDRRRNVVNVLDVYEARQWELPVAFVCGLNERHFPLYHRENPLLPDPARTRDRQQEEHFLFDLATTRATDEIVLSYARFNEQGDPQLRSFFLEEEGEISSSSRILPRSGQMPQWPHPQPPIDLRTRHAKLAPTSIESFLQCPFQFFAKKTLNLRKAPEKPRDRLNALVQGSILHRALAEGAMDRVFDEECRERNIPVSYRTEAVRLELLRHFNAFRSDTNWPLNWSRLTEQEFVVALTPELSIRGRIDRLDVGPDDQAIVIDYKYSAAAKIRERIDSDPVQAGLYLSAAERFFHLRPAGMFYCGLRQSVSWEGWHANIPGLGIGEARTPDGLRELMTSAETRAIEVFEAIAAGHREVRPADRGKCRFCDFNAICRVESLARVSASSSQPE